MSTASTGTLVALIAQVRYEHRKHKYASSTTSTGTLVALIAPLAQVRY